MTKISWDFTLPQTSWATLLVKYMYVYSGWATFAICEWIAQSLLVLCRGRIFAHLTQFVAYI